MEDSKRCNNKECREIKELSEFDIDERKTDGRGGQCKKCKNKKRRERDRKKRETAKILKNKTVKKKVVKIPANKCECARGGVIFKRDCVPGCNDACDGCKNPQMQNIQSGN